MEGSETRIDIGHQESILASNSNIQLPENIDAAGGLPVPESSMVKPKVPDAVGQSGMDLSKYEALREAAVNEDWETALGLIDDNRDSLTDVITQEGMTALHLAAKNEHSKLVTTLVNHMSRKDLEIKDNVGRTALHYVASVGTVREAQAMVKKNKLLTQAEDDNGLTPLFLAAYWGQKDMLCYLANAESYKSLEGPLAPWLILQISRFGWFDISLYFLKKNKDLALAFDSKQGTILHFLAKEPSLFLSGTKLGLWDRLLYPIVHVGKEQSPNSIQLSSNWSKGIVLKFLGWLVPRISTVHAVKLRHKQSNELAELVFKCFKDVIASNNDHILFECLADAMHLAIGNGSIELVQACLKLFPDMLWYRHREQHRDQHRDRVFLHLAIENRQAKIYSYLIKKAGKRKISSVNLSVENGNSLLHFAAKLPPFPKLNSISGAALQMQRELQWFREVAKLIGGRFISERNGDKGDGLTAHEIFIKEHEDLKKRAEKWMKDTSSSCTIVATLVATVVFASIITVPGGTTGDTGIPIFLPATSFGIFSIANSIALLLSLSSVLLFLAILTSSYGEEDFLYSLPKMLFGGLALLLFSIAAVMIAFAHALQIALITRFKWIFIVSYLFVAIPVGLFALLQLSLFIQIFRCTVGGGIFGQQSLVSRAISKLINLPIRKKKLTHKMP